MTDYSHILFNQTPEQLRRIGARGGRATARNRRARLQALATPAQEPAPRVDPEAETAAEAIVALDAQFPWYGVAALCFGFADYSAGLFRSDDRGRVTFSSKGAGSTRSAAFLK